jgi:hypothetical protein
MTGKGDRFRWGMFRGLTLWLSQVRRGFYSTLSVGSSSTRHTTI